MGKIFEIVDILKTSFRVMFDNLSIIWPLVFYIMITGMFLTPQLAVKPVIVLFMLVLSAAFIAGWYPVVNKNISLFFIKAFNKEEKALEYIKNYKEFFPGVEKNILSMLSLFAISFVIILIILIIVQVIFNVIFSEINVQLLSSFKKELFKVGNYKELASIFSSKKYHCFYYLLVIEMAILTVYSYLTMFWAQAIILYSKNPLKALLECVKTSFRKPIDTMLIFFVNFMINLIIILTALIAGQNSLFQIFSLLVTIYLTVYLTILNFLSFEKFSKKVNSYHGADSIR